MDDFRCSVRSAEVDEQLAGSAPSDREWLFVEHPGPWAAKAPEALGVAGPGRVQLIRRYGGTSRGAGVRVFRASLDGTPRVTTALLDDVRDLPDLADADLVAHPDPLWLVCTNGRRDVCCAELGRPVTAALAARWPDETWETTHLGGHRFAATLLALPSGVALGRVTPESALAAVAGLAAGRVPLDASRGRAGWTARAQFADLALRAEHGWTGADDVGLEGGPDDGNGDVVRLSTPDGVLAVTVAEEAGAVLRPSCVGDKTAVAVVRAVVAVRRVA